MQSRATIYAFRSLGLLCLGLMTFSGCDRNPEVVPVSGKVSFNGKPLQFGTVMFQPEQGQAAVGEIQPDGTFVMSTYAPGDGAVPGPHKVCIRCYAGQKPGAMAQQTGGEMTLGALLIPRKYTRFGTSELTADVKFEGMEPVVFELVGAAGR